MANHVKIASSLTPIAEDTIAEGGSAVHSAIGADIGKTLGSNYSVNVAHSTTGYTSGTPSYLEAPATGGTAVTIISGGAGVSYIKHTGFKYNSGALGDAVTSTTDLIVQVGDADFCTVPPGGSITLPNIDAGITLKGISDSAETIAIEYAKIS